MTIRLNGRFLAGNAQKTNSDWNATSGYAQILNKPTNLVHTDGNETIAGTKTFSSIVFGVTPATSTSDTSIATAAFVGNKITAHNSAIDSHPDLRADMVDLETGLDTEAQTRSDDDDYLQSEIDALSAANSIKDIVGTYADLQAYPTSSIELNDIIKVLNDETHQGTPSYYKWQNYEGLLQWVYIASEAPTYTKSEIDSDFYNKTYVDTNLVYNTLTINTYPLTNNITLKISDFQNDTGYALDNAVVHLTGDETINGTKTFNSLIQGTAYRAQWGDLAENYLTDKVYPKGTLVQFGGEKELTIASKIVNAVITTEPGVILNGKEEGQGIALIGRVPVRVIGKVKKFDKIALSYIDGVGCVSNDSDNVIGRALESKDSDEEGLILCSVRMNLD